MIPAAGPPAPIAAPEVEVLARADGTPVWLVERHDLPLVRVELSLRPPGDLDAGALTALAESWTRGTRTHPGAAWADAVEALGAEVSAGCAPERCWIDVDAPTEHVAEAVTLAGEALREPALGGLGALRRAMRAEWRTDWLAPELVPEVALERLTWPAGHPKREDHDAAFFRGMRTARVRAAQVRLLADAAARVVVVGDLGRDEALPALAGFGPFGGAAPVARWTPSPDAWPRVVLVDLPGEPDARIAVRMPAPPRDDPEATPFALAARALAGDFTGRLNVRLREREGLAYGVYADAEDGPAYGLWTLRATVPAERTGDAVRALAEELDRAAGGDLSADELDVVRRLYAGDAAAAADTREGLAYPLGVEAIADLPPGETWRRIDTSRDVSDVSVNHAARWLGGPRLWVVAGDADVIEPALEAAGLPPSRIWSACVAVYGSAC